MSRAQQDRFEGPLPRYDSLTDLVAFAAAKRVVSYIDARKQKQTIAWEDKQEDREDNSTELDTCQRQVVQPELSSVEGYKEDETEEERYVVAQDACGNLLKKRITSETTNMLLSGLSLTHIDFGSLNSLSEASDSLKTGCRNKKTPLVVERDNAVNLLLKIPSPVENPEEGSVELGESTSPRSWKNLPHAAEKLLSAVWAPQLREISLASNQLESVDLSPLADCINLESVLLNCNKLRNINLEPLSSCTKLEKLWLHHNQLLTISLEPLRECSSLRSIYLDHNELTHCIDLEPLKKCKLLKGLRLGSNNMKGDLDVTPLLHCNTLSVFDVSATTRLVARFKVKTLPPALKKHEKDILWIDEQLNSFCAKTLKGGIPNDRNLVKPRILLLGFKSFQVALENLFAKVSSLEVDSIGNLRQEEVSNTLKNLQNLQNFDAVVCDSSIDWVIPKLKLVHSDIPIIVVSSDMTSEAAGRCLRFGACCLARAPLGPEDSFRVKEWAEKHSHSNCELRMASQMGHPTSFNRRQPEDDYIEQKLVGLLKTNAVDEVSEHELIQELSDKDIVDNRTELKAIEEIFRMKSNNLLESTYRHIAISCGLPSCAYRLLHDAIQREEQHVDCGAFGRFWKKHFLHRNREERLFILLCPYGKKLTSKSPLRILVEDLLKRRLLRRVSSNTVQVQLVDCALECVLYSLTGNFEISGITLKDVEREKLCHALILAEQGSFKRPLEFLRPEKFDALRKDFKIASQGRYLSCIGSNVIGLDDFLRFNHERNWLTAKGAMSFFQILIFLRCACKDTSLAVEDDWLLLSDFARFYCTISELSNSSALKLLFLVLDTDMDGVVSFEDFVSFYKDKARIYAREGLILADSRVIWRHFLDICGERNDEKNVLSLGDLSRLEPKQRSFLLKAMLLRDDGVSLVDIRASLVPTTGLAE
ncbi:hypothetical protein Gasu2_14110 [Galdieria sulphuraria]|uniref:Receptor kinase n=1 Tax=Galdieria sulphuraria TaxID=130081 RepID=M2WSC0_GALSU|nr:receptor kinase [Galdieria sulphuraria]EME26755.1 receptor kinase [Galdieria sulphuraria]GJD07028.1 hypothetical protein Gasu2_14110 [Galdieria sulphuraria]|eukprot:XP_005703275.1 receptor kinase [Galdieria sulphuraria]